MIVIIVLICNNFNQKSFFNRWNLCVRAPVPNLYDAIYACVMATVALCIRMGLILGHEYILGPFILCRLVLSLSLHLCHLSLKHRNTSSMYTNHTLAIIRIHNQLFWPQQHYRISICPHLQRVHHLLQIRLSLWALFLEVFKFPLEHHLACEGVKCVANMNGIGIKCRKSSEWIDLESFFLLFQLLPLSCQCAGKLCLRMLKEHLAWTRNDERILRMWMHRIACTGRLLLRTSLLPLY